MLPDYSVTHVPGYSPERVVRHEHRRIIPDTGVMKRQPPDWLLRARKVADAL